MVSKFRPAHVGLSVGGAGIALLVAACSSGEGTGSTPPPSGGSGGGSATPVAGSSGAGTLSSLAGSSGAGAAAVSPVPGASAGSAGQSPGSVGGASAGGSGDAAGSSALGGGGGGGASGSTSAGSAGTNAAGTGGGGGDDCPAVEQLEKFSFFVTSYKALQRLSGSTNGFGGDLRYGEADGLSGADKICTEIAEYSMPCAGKKQWRAFLSVTKGGADGGPIHAIDRVGEGPWYDRVGRIVAMNKAALVNQRPQGADPAILNDLPNEDGVPNHDPDGTGPVDNHDMLTGTNDKGQLYTVLSDPLKSTCKDWTSSERWGNPRVGHPWPTGAGKGGGGGGFPGGGPPGGGGFGDLANWMSALDEAGCAPGASLVEMGPPMASNPTVGSGGGYGGFYCFALKP